MCVTVVCVTVVCVTVVCVTVVCVTVVCVTVTELFLELFSSVTDEDIWGEFTLHAIVSAAT